MSTKSQKAMRRAMFDRHANELPRSFVVEGQIQDIMVDVYHHNMKVKEATDRILALIAEAMLSEEVYAEMDRARFEGTVWNNEETMIVEGEEGSNQAVITAALVAAGITGAGQEGGEGE